MSKRVSRSTAQSPRLEPGSACTSAWEQGTLRGGVTILVAVFSTAPLAARADELDHDFLLTEAPATPKGGTVRVQAASMGQSSNGAALGGTSNVSVLSGMLLWAPIDSLAGDVGVYWQPGPNISGPSLRLRYQMLYENKSGLDVAVGARYKFVPFVHPDAQGVGELEFLVAAGKHFGLMEVALNAVFGIETGGGDGKDIEARAFAGYHLLDNLRVGIDSRIQIEVGDEGESPTKVGRDFELSAGPALAWVPAERLLVQLLLGVVMPKGTDVTSPVGMLAASFDF